MAGADTTITGWATELCFDAVGFARADVPLSLEAERYRQFVASGMHGEMAYLAEHADVRERADHPGILDGARTVICLARRYDRPTSEREPAGVASYASGRDYHNHLKKKLRKLAQRIEETFEGERARAFCDTAPLLERAWASRAGLGFVGKNGLLIVPGQGSFCLLGEVVTSLALDEHAYGQPMGERCGSCTACLDACPTDAFVKPFVLEPRRCISYWTIESRELPPPALWPGFGEHLFGCDDCQTSCPYNTRPIRPAANVAPFLPHPGFDTEPDWFELDEATLRERFAGSPLRRAGLFGMRRNTLLRAFRRGDASALQNGLDRAKDPKLIDFARKLLGTLAADRDAGANDLTSPGD